MGTLHWGGVGGGLAKPGSYIYILYIYIYIIYIYIYIIYIYIYNDPCEMPPIFFGDQLDLPPSQ